VDEVLKPPLINKGPFKNSPLEHTYRSRDCVQHAATMTMFTHTYGLPVYAGFVVYVDVAGSGRKNVEWCPVSKEPWFNLGVKDALCSLRL